MPDDKQPDDIAAEVARRARDAADVAVGLGVLALQRAQVLRHELARNELLGEAAGLLRSGVAGSTRQIAAWLDGTRSCVSAQVAPMGARLPGAARELAGKAWSKLEVVGAQLRQLATPGT
ncbi:MAG: hypothetical protein M0Z46_09250 [Actinomycetota bacterium]|jgi:hypothetical protein|nr:hypothetical protein [Actinomycetota bacterium]